MATMIWTIVAMAVLTDVGSVMQNPPSAVPPARDGNIAIEQELCAARKKATLAAYDLFIARHPQHPLAQVAMKERAELAASGRRD